MEAQVDPYEVHLRRAMLDARQLQDFLWGDESYTLREFDVADWVPLFAKRVDRIARVSKDNPNWKVELRKRLLQQAALSLQAILTLNKLEEKTDGGY